MVEGDDTHCFHPQLSTLNPLEQSLRIERPSPREETRDAPVSAQWNAPGDDGGKAHSHDSRPASAAPLAEMLLDRAGAGRRRVAGLSGTGDMASAGDRPPDC